MIDAKAVVADLDSFGVPRAGDAAASEPETWLREALQGLPVRYGSDAGGNRWVLLPGLDKRTVVLGAYTPQDVSLESRLGVITGVETLKALAKRFGGQLPCGVQLLLWKENGPVGSLEGQSSTGDPDGGKSAAYLELRMEPGTELSDAGVSLGMPALREGAEGPQLNARLLALGAEAIQELTGSAVAAPVLPEGGAAAMAKQGVPAAVMYVQAFAAAGDGSLSDAAKLHILQAAESFGRWVEATVHLVAGDEMDLWALEHRVPHS